MDMLPVDIAHGERLALGTDQIIVLATAEQTGGALFAGLVRMPPGGGPPVMHKHAPGEVYHVLEGEFAFYVGPPDGVVERVVVAAGQVMPLAGDTPHTIRNESDADAVAFVVHAPGAPMEGFSRAAAALATNGSPSMEAVLAIAAEHGIELLGPVPTTERA
ncbi:cupin domain-containing protein [Cellulomonas sp.]|uniref:cupin domain-containing protein n=1 Tax=Cellulomonas sp. TaxID=40001 RepID=UPI003BA9D1C0